MLLSKIIKRFKLTRKIIKKPQVMLEVFFI